MSTVAHMTRNLGQHEDDINWIAIDQVKNKKKCLQWSTYLTEEERRPALEEQHCTTLKATGLLSCL